ncbi:hypothetical protein [Actinoplanes friuliensis]|uniref:hypothetical protein n=1 Tax=Actinoplanes friuliensis TaxID=196914 RepID=UPI0011DE1123|nr:hypothetical protein [Actinoplanes friuliensis]
MRNEVPDAGENVYNSVVARRNRRRKQVIIGVVGLAVLGAGSALVTSQVADNSGTKTRDAAASLPLQTTDSQSSGSVAPSSAAERSDAESAAPSQQPSETVSVASKTRQEEIDALRKLAANKDSDVTRPLPPAAGGYQVPEGEVKLRTYGSVRTTGETLKVYSAKDDLTGQKELAWVADGGESVGDARCTQKIRVSPDAPAKERPTLLLCWRTSETKSVYTVSVSVHGVPSKKKSVAAITKEWRLMG